MVKAERTRSRIPIFGSIDEEADFWSTHDSTEFEDEFEPVDVEVSPHLRNRFVLTVEVDAATWDRLRDLAQRHGLRRSELAREWVLEGVARATAQAENGPAATGRPID